MIELYFFIQRNPIEPNSIQEVAALYVLKKKKVLEMLKMALDVKATVNPENTEELRRLYESIMQMVLPELKRAQMERTKQMADLLKEEVKNIYSVKTTGDIGRKKKIWRRH